MQRCGWRGRELTHVAMPSLTHPPRCVNEQRLPAHPTTQERRISPLSLLFERQRVHAVAEPRGGRPIGEDVPEVCVAHSAGRLNAGHAVRVIGVVGHHAWRVRIGEGGPACAGVKLRAGVKEGRAAAGASIEAGLNQSRTKDHGPGHITSLLDPLAAPSSQDAP